MSLTCDTFLNISGRCAWGILITVISDDDDEIVKHLFALELIFNKYPIIYIYFN